MCNIMITADTPPEFKQAIAEGAIAAENKALKETIEMLLCEIAQKDEIIELYRWKEQRTMEQVLKKYREPAPRATLRQRFRAALHSLRA